MECFNFSDLAVVTLNSKTATRYKHFHDAKPSCATHLRIQGEADIVSMRTMEKYETEEFL